MTKKIITLFLFFILIYACGSSDDDTNGGSTDNFDRSILLTHLADNIIIPSYQDFKDKMDILKTTGSAFTTTPDQTNLSNLRVAWLDAYKEWQHVEMFDIGKAEELGYRFYMNIFPLNTSDIEANIASGSYDLNISNNHDAQGFPALDYLLYGLGNSGTDIIAKYTTDVNADGYKQYLIDVLNQMSSLTNQVFTDWASSYRDEFVANTGNTDVSALNKFTNDYIEYYERKLRANKFGIPAGVFSSDPLPEKVEAYYNQNVSKELALEALEAFKDFFEGKYKGNATANRSSYQQYLEALDRSDLANAIITQLNTAKTQINTLNANFYQQVNSDNSAMLKSYDELQKAVVLLKVDMASALDISILFVDADGD